ncbi:hypothetical protein LCGC14_2824410, partial [marine sediment metagenome]
PYSGRGKEFTIHEERTLESKFPRAYSYLCDNQAALQKRIWFGKNAKELSGQWYGMMYLDSRWAFVSPHLLTPSLSDKSNFSLGDGTLFSTGTAGVTSIVLEDSEQSPLYVLGVLNSSLLSLYATHHSPVFQGGYYKFSAPYLKPLPIRAIDFDDSRDVARHDQIVELARQMLSLHKRLPTAKTSHAKTVLQRQIDATDRQIDQLVYELYELTDEEIAIVEEATD